MDNKTISLLLVDDESPAISLMSEYVEKIAEREGISIEVQTASNGFEAVKLISKHTFEMVILDVQMPKLTGFETLELIDELPVIIFSTAYDEFAVKAFEINAADYLLKPYSFDRFSQAFMKGLSLLATGKESAAVKQVVKTYQKETETLLSRIVIKDKQSVKIIPVDHIHFLEASDDYVQIVCTEGKFLKKETMSYYESHLDEKEFVRIHRSFIVRFLAIRQIQLVEKDSYICVLHSGDKLPISRQGYQKLRELMK